MKNNTSTQEKKRNQLILADAVLKYWETHETSRRLKCLPTQKYLADKSQLSIRTVKRHWAELKNILNS